MKTTCIISKKYNYISYDLPKMIGAKALVVMEE